MRAPEMASVLGGRPTRSLLAAILVLATALTAFRLGKPDRMYHDETYYVRGSRYFTGGELQQPDLSHPVLGATTIAVATAVLGDRPAVWRLPSAVAGVLSILVLFLLARRLGAGEGVALTAAGLWAVDPARLAFSRIAMIDSVLVAMILLAALAFVHAAGRIRAGAAAAPWMAAAGFLGGAAASVKWSGGLPLVIGAVVVALVCAGRQPMRARRLVAAASAAGCCLAAGFVGYALPYLPMLLDGATVGDLAALPAKMWRFHQDYDVGHNQASPFWSWPLQLVTMPLVVADRPEQTAILVRALVGNPVTWLLVVPAGAYQLVRGMTARSALRIIAGAGVLLHWLPWALSDRMMFFYYWLPAVPFGAVAIALTLRDLSSRARRWCTTGVVALSAAAFFLLVPAAPGTPVLRSLFRPIALSWPLQIDERPPGKFQRRQPEAHHRELAIKSRNRVQHRDTRIHTGVKRRVFEKRWPLVVAP